MFFFFFFFFFFDGGILKFCQVFRFSSVLWQCTDRRDSAFCRIFVLIFVYMTVLNINIKEILLKAVFRFVEQLNKFRIFKDLLKLVLKVLLS